MEEALDLSFDRLLMIMEVIQPLVEVLFLEAQEFNFLVYSEPDGIDCSLLVLWFLSINRLTPNYPYMSHTLPLTSKRCILYIYSTNTGTEYFKHALYTPFFLSSKCSLFHNANLFGTCIIHILYTGCA